MTAHDELSGHRVIGVHPSLAHLPSATLVARWVPEEGVVLQCSDLSTQLAAAREGIGVAVLPCFVADRCASLVRLFAPEEALRSSLWIVWHKELRRSARVQALVKHLSRALEGDRHLLAGGPV
jgi:DNA-binding transcriptional LysR family regulator